MGNTRRSRLTRTSTGKRLQLSPRDFEIFTLLERYRYLRSTYLHAFVGGASETRFKERLGDLYHEGGYLDRPSQQWQFVNARYMPLVYENTEAARKVLRQNGIAVDREDGECRQFAHTLMICEILASIELGVRDDSGVRFVSWLELLTKAPESTRTASYPLRVPVTEGKAGYLVPDAVFGLEYLTDGRKTYRFFALEADRSTMPIVRSSPEQSSYRRKILVYREIIARQLHRTYLGVPNLFILTVTTSDAHKAHVLASVKAVTGGGSTIFLFKTTSGVDSRPNLALLADPWERAGHPPFSIATSG
jgi:hypothetical protein